MGTARKTYKHLVSTNEKVATTIKEFRKSNKNKFNKRNKR